MKKIKNGMLLAGYGLLATSVLTISSCKKTTTTPPTPAPTIASFTPNSGAVGTTVTITGTNLGSATAVKFNGTTATVTANSATSITVTVPAGATDGTITVTTAGGTATSAASYDVTVVVVPTSNDVAAADLIAHWTFDNTKTEAISGVTPATTGTVTTSASGGQIGGYASFGGGYLVYPSIAKINKDTVLANGFTLTMWAKIPTQTTLTSLWQINGNIGDIWATAGLAFRHQPNDTLDFDGMMTHVNGTGTHSTGATAFLEGANTSFKFAPTAWAFISMVYDSTQVPAGSGNRSIKYYGNGALIGTSTITIIPTAEQFELISSASFGGTGRNNVTFGAFNWSPTPFAAGGGGAAGWQAANLITGTEIDDTRLFRRPLTLTELGQLYTRGLAGN